MNFPFAQFVWHVESTQTVWWTVRRITYNTNIQTHTHTHLQVVRTQTHAPCCGAEYMYCEVDDGKPSPCSNGLAYHMDVMTFSYGRPVREIESLPFVAACGTRQERIVREDNFIEWNRFWVLFIHSRRSAACSNGATEQSVEHSSMMNSCVVRDMPELLFRILLVNHRNRIA